MVSTITQFKNSINSFRVLIILALLIMVSGCSDTLSKKVKIEVKTTTTKKYKYSIVNFDLESPNDSYFFQEKLLSTKFRKLGDDKFYIDRKLAFDKSGILKSLNTDLANLVFEFTYSKNDIIIILEKEICPKIQTQNIFPIETSPIWLKMESLYDQINQKRNSSYYGYNSIQEPQGNISNIVSKKKQKLLISKFWATKNIIYNYTDIKRYIQTDINVIGSDHHLASFIELEHEDQHTKIKSNISMFTFGDKVSEKSKEIIPHIDDLIDKYEFFLIDIDYSKRESYWVIMNEQFFQPRYSNFKILIINYYPPFIHNPS